MVIEYAAGELFQILEDDLKVPETQVGKLFLGIKTIKFKLKILI